MNEEIDDAGCYREDFSTESDWEVFNAQLVEVLQSWELANGDWGRALAADELFRCKWRVETETLQLLSNDITVRYYAADLPDLPDLPDREQSEETKAKTPQVHLDLMSLENTFGPPVAAATAPGNLHSLARLFGLRRFVVIHPAEPTLFLTNPSEFSYFLSSANVVAAEVGSTVPLFVQIYDPKWNYFLGVHVSPSMRINFDVVSMETTQPRQRFLSEFRTLFKEKLPVEYVRPAVVSVRQTYVLDSVKIRVPLRVPFGTRVAADSGPFSEVGTGTRFTALPYGYFPDASADLYAVFTWPELAETIAFDSEMRTEFVPSKAHEGSIHQVVQAKGYLSSCLKDFKKLAGATQTLESFVGRNFAGGSSALGAANPLDQLTEHRLPHLRSPRQSRPDAGALQTQRKHLPGPMNKNELNEMLLYLFPDTNPAEALYPYAKAGSKVEFDPLRIKSAAPDSLVSRLSCLLATCYSHFGGMNGLAQLWAAFVRELHILVDNGIRIPGVAPGFPDTRTCLLHQKLQLLNVCLERRARREAGEDDDDHDGGRAEDDEDENDEFFECDEEAEGSGGGDRDGDGDGEAGGDRRTLDAPEGRRHRLGDLKLLGCDEPLYVPKLQVPVPKTEDQQNEDAEAMMQLGPASGLTTQMMCPLLYSDMEAFKAANPRAAIEDFIRWYSPKDWEEAPDAEGRTVGRLSGRMAEPDNMWQTVWSQVHPVPAARQKRLFDDAKETLKVLHYLESRSLGEIHDLALVPLLHAAALKLQDVVEEIGNEVAARAGCEPGVRGFFAPALDEILAALCRLSRDASLPDEALLERMAELELRIYRFMCYEQTFETLPLGRGRDADEGAGEAAADFRIELDPRRDAVALALQAPVSKDYVMRVDGATTSASKGAAGPQFLRAIVQGERLTLCGAFSENTTFV